MAEYSGNEVPLVPGGLRVYREWGLIHNGLLRAVAWPTIWRPGLNEAICQRHNQHQAPFSGCTCGFYGKYRPESLGSFVLGVAELSGRVILGTKGARAQFARIVALNLNQIPHDERNMTKIHYPDVTWFPNNSSMFTVYPPQDVNELVPEEPEQAGDWMSITRFNGPASSGFASPPISISDLHTALRKLTNQ